MDYYLEKHIPTCKQLWQPIGLKTVYVCKIDDAKQPHATRTILIWNDAESWSNASSSTTMENLVDDMQNFTDTIPTAVVGNLVG